MGMHLGDDRKATAAWRRCSYELNLLTEFHRFTIGHASFEQSQDGRVVWKLTSMTLHRRLHGGFETDY